MVVSPPKGAQGPDLRSHSQFKHNDEVVWRVRVLDQDGKPVTDKDVKSLQVVLSSGEKFNMRYGGHPHTNPPGPLLVARAGRSLPIIPPGRLSYKVVATTAQGTQTWEPFNVAPSQLTVLAGTAKGSE